MRIYIHTPLKYKTNTFGLPEGAVTEDPVPAQVQGVALRTLPGLLLAESQVRFSHNESVRAEHFIRDGSLFPLQDGDPALVGQDTLHYHFRNGETARNGLVQSPEVQASLVVAQGLGDDFGHDRGHP